MKRVLNPGLAALVGCLMLYGLPSEAATVSVNCPGQSLQATVDAAEPGDVIQVSGTCNENILITNEKQRISIQGAAGGEVHGPSNSLPTINVRGKGILIQGLDITGGRSGIHVNRGSNAVIDDNEINSNESGIRVDQESFAVIINNNINGNTFGILVDESSTVRVGYNLDTDTSASPNVVTGNGTGIRIQGSSNAKIAGNRFSSNTGSGVVVLEQSYANIGGNNIGNNGVSGIDVRRNSSVDLANAVGGPSFLGTLNNSNAGINGFVLPQSSFGVSCQQGGYVAGFIGTLSGFSGAKSIIAPCQDLLP
jgi:parallel beta-helix repeat protein